MWGERFDSTQLAAVHGMRRRKSTAHQGGDAELGWRTCLPTTAASTGTETREGSRTRGTGGTPGTHPSLHRTPPNPSEHVTSPGAGSHTAAGPPPQKR